MIVSLLIIIDECEYNSAMDQVQEHIFIRIGDYFFLPCNSITLLTFIIIKYKIRQNIYIKENIFIKNNFQFL